ncbi:LLM class F420-dependent oxidoreductase [Pseudonocardia cypriaca]|uniref:Putative F420-dependent oxidoreductase n=1 Tax=Pseudonocardia cypriaca TaxID=882449 RepID=A0A543FQF0_9PSEU|nr:LLM class F420-dependent oxidoreductase [Pseudonocardia cypriaca]TQM36062.1 putative F420-dependent oxidoreductase [Pseudonocardia cypriaca]
MDHGVFTFLTDYGTDGLALARAVEERGFDGLYLTEHTHIPASRESAWSGGSELPRRYSHTYDPFVALAAMAAVTERITLGTAVSLVLQHHPIGLAKTVASLDRIAGGRFELGVGPGWNREEMANHGVDPRTRTRRMLEHIAAMREIWTADEAEFHGEFVDFDPIWSWPKPVRTPPVLIGGEGSSVLDRVLSHGDGWMPRGAPGDDVDALAGRIAELRRRAAEAGRGHLTVTVFGAVPDRAVLEEYAAAGVDRVLYSVPDAGEDEVLRTLDELAALRG